MPKKNPPSRTNLRSHLYSEPSGSAGKTGRGRQPAFLTALVLSALVLGTGACSMFSSPPAGKLIAATDGGKPVAFKSNTFKLGSFVLSWYGTGFQDAQLSVFHKSDPSNKRALWQSVPGQAFIAAAAGKEEVHEARGSFFVKDEISRRCKDQTVTDVTPAAGFVRFSGSLLCDGGKTVPYTLTFRVAADKQLRFEIKAGDAKSKDINRLYLAYASTADEHFFGFGEQFTYFDQKGKRLPIFVMEQGIGRGAQPITMGADIQADSGGDWHTSYAGVPHYITSKHRSLFLENLEYSVFDMTRDNRVDVEIFSNHMRGRILKGDSPLELIEEFTKYSGRMRELPAWSIRGAIIGMQGGTDKVLKTLAALKKENTPLSGFWLQDWVGQRRTTFGKQLWWNWELDNDRYPNWDQLRAKLAADDIRLLTYINPFLADVKEKKNARRNLFKEAAEKGYLVRTKDNKPYMILNTSFSAGLIDLTNPAARAWIKEIIKKNLINVGSSGWMADFGEALPYDAVLFSGESPVTYHNKYPVEWAKVNREAIREAGREKDIVFFSRSGYTRSPGYTTLFWLGDQLVSWDKYDGIKTAVTGLLSSGISGYSLNHSDIGGYTTITNPIANYHRSKELELRWIELSAFNVIYRTHEGNRPGENHQFDSDAETLKHFSRFAKIYAAWEPYRRKLVRDAATRGLPVVRAPFLHYPADPKTWTMSYEQFMVGSEFMMAPVVDEGATKATAYLPGGVWVHLFTGKKYGKENNKAGGVTVTVDAPIGKPAVFYKAGSKEGEAMRARLKKEGLL